MKVIYHTLILLFIGLLVSSCSESTREYHVSKDGDDLNKGSERSPFLTISAAAAIAMPGDIITIHEGVYREYINPPRGGSSDTARIVYRAAPGEDVKIKGSEQITSWRKMDPAVWVVEIPDSFFNGYNPYRLKIGWVSEDWLAGGHWTHCGDVYLNGEAFYEKLTEQEVLGNINSWYTQTDSLSQITRIVANFGDKDPNLEQTEINVRESIIYPSDTTVNYLTISGLTFMHSASAWGPPTYYQGGAVGTNGGHHWIVEQCAFINAKTNGFSMGIPKIRRENMVYNETGHHIIRNNIFKRCGQSGIVGNGYNTASHLIGNYIGETAYRREFWGAEPAAIKFHWAVDLVVENNHLARSNRVLSLWIDYGNQNIRVTRNFLGGRIKMEMDHGPIMIDNNIISSGYINWYSGGVTLAHNLLDIDLYRHVTDTREPAFFKPHTLVREAKLTSTYRDERWYNNIFTKKGLDSLITLKHPNPTPGSDADFNLYLNGSKPSPMDENSIVSDMDSRFKIFDEDGDVTVEFYVPAEAFSIVCPLIHSDFLGIYEPAKQRMENPDGTALIIDHDILGNIRNTNKITVGPFADVKEGLNRLTLFTIKDKGPQLTVK